MENVTCMKLTTQNVQNVFKSCLYASNTTTVVDGCDQERNPISVYAVANNFKFDPEMLAQEKSHIEQLLSQLPEQFFNGGWTFGDMFYNRDGDTWTGILPPMEYLLALGLAIGKISFTTPRDMWWRLPGGMPYVKLAAS